MLSISSNISLLINFLSQRVPLLVHGEVGSTYLNVNLQLRLNFTHQWQIFGVLSVKVLLWHLSSRLELGTFITAFSNETFLYEHIISLNLLNIESIQYLFQLILSFNLSVWKDSFHWNIGIYKAIKQSETG